MARTLEIKGLDELLNALDESPDTARPILSRGMSDSLGLLRDTLKAYPPQPPRDRSKTFNTYVRGRGHYPRSAFKKGMFSAKAARGMVKAGKVRLTSERLGTKWTHKTEFTKDAVIGVIGNTASYADVVQGDMQTDYHAETGWVTLQQALEQHEREIYRIFEDSVAEFLEEMAK